MTKADRKLFATIIGYCVGALIITTTPTEGVDFFQITQNQANPALSPKVT
jgi:hypothetical protein